MAAQRTYPVCGICETRRLERMLGPKDLGFLYCKRCDGLDTITKDLRKNPQDWGGEPPNGTT